MHVAHPELISRQSKQKKFYDQHAKPLPLLKKDDPIRMLHNGEWQRGVVSAESRSPRSFIVETDDGSVLRRNRRHIVKTHEPFKPLAGPDLDDTPASLTETVVPVSQNNEQFLANRLNSDKFVLVVDDSLNLLFVEMTI